MKRIVRNFKFIFAEEKCKEILLSRIPALSSVFADTFDESTISIVIEDEPKFRVDQLTGIIYLSLKDFVDIYPILGKFLSSISLEESLQNSVDRLIEELVNWKRKE